MNFDRVARSRARILAFVVAMVIAVGTSPFIMGFVSLSSTSDKWEFNAPGQSVSAFSSKAVEFTNSGFTSGTSASNFVFNSSTVSGWERDSKLKTSGVVAGVLNTKQFTAWKSSHVRNLDFLRVNPSTSLTNNSNVLAITNNTESNSQQGARAHAGFLSNPISFAADSHYVVTVDFYAVSGFGSFYLIPTDEFDSKITPMIYLDQVSYGNGNIGGRPIEDPDGVTNIAEGQSVWRTASFYVSTDMLASQSFRLGLYLGSQTDTSKGVIYFQNATVTQYSEPLFDQMWNKASLPYVKMLEGTSLEFNDLKPLVKKLELSQEYEVNQKSSDRLSYMEINPLENIKNVIDVDFDTNNIPSYTPSFVTNHFNLPYELQYYPGLANPHNTAINPSINTDRIPQALNFEDVGYLYPAKPTLVQTDVNSYVVVSAKDVMLLAAKNQTASLRLNDPFIVKRHQIYMVSFYSLTANGQSASIRVRDVRYKDENRAQNPKLAEAEFHAIKQTSDAEHLNGWALNTLFIVGECYEDLPVDIEFWIGKEGEKAQSDYVLIDDFKIQRVSTEYYNTYSKDESVPVVNLELSGQTTMINNAKFNIGKPGSIENPYPLVADDWTIDYGDEDSVISGIVNTDPDHWFDYDSYGFAKPLNAIVENNIKTDINNNVFMMQNRDTTWQKLSSNTFSLTGGTNVISFDIARQYYPALGMKLWAVVETYDTEIARIDLSKKAEGSSRTLTTIDWQRFSFAVIESEFTQREVKVSFMLGTRDKASQPAAVFIDNVAHESLDADAEVVANAHTNLVNTKRFFASDSPNTLLSYDEKYDELTIVNTEDSYVATVVNKLTETLKSGEHYLFTVQVSIKDRGAKYINKYDDDGNRITDFSKDYDYGVNFSIEGLSGGFKNLGQSSINDMWGRDHDFVTLRFLLNPGQETDLALEIKFGNEYMNVQSEVCIREMLLTTITEDEFNELKTELDEAVKADKNHNIAVVTEIFTNDSPSDTSDRNKPNIDWAVVAPAIILGITLIFAIIAVSLRRIKFKRHISKHYTSYSSDDRSARNAAVTRRKKVD